MEVEERMAGEPGLDPRMFVSGAVAGDRPGRPQYLFRYVVRSSQFRDLPSSSNPARRAEADVSTFLLWRNVRTDTRRAGRVCYGLKVPTLIDDEEF